MKRSAPLCTSAITQQIFLTNDFSLLSDNWGEKKLLKFQITLKYSGLLLISLRVFLCDNNLSI